MPSRLTYFFPPAPTFTDANLPSLVGKVYIITGAASGVGFELARTLYAAGGTVYIGARSAARCQGAIERIETVEKGKGEKPAGGIPSGGNGGRLEAMVMDLANLRSVKEGVEAFLAKEERLNVLVHNAGVMTPPKGSKDSLVSHLTFLHFPPGVLESVCL